MSNNQNQHGMPSWIEHQSPAKDEAVGFYREVLGWDIAPMNMPDGNVYSCVQVAGKPIGGFTEGGGGWLCYLTVDDVDARADRAVKAGAVIEQAPFSAPGVGRMCTLRDPQGARFALITYAAS